MALPKVTDSVTNITDQPVRPVISASALQALFDEIGKDLKVYLNDSLTVALESTTDGNSGLDNIGMTPIPGLVATTPQEALEELKALSPINIADGSVADVKLSNTPGQIKDVVSIHTRQISEFGVNVKDFGAVGDGITDDYIALQNAIDYAVLNNRTLVLNGKHYVSQTVDLSNVKLVTGNGSKDSISYDARIYNGEVVGTGWFKDTHPPFSFYVDGLDGDLIVSDIANPIIKCEEGNINLYGIGIYGWLDNATQVGFMDTLGIPTSYNGTIKQIINCNIKYCGSHGIHLKRGMEYFNWSGTDVSMNGGYGLYVDNVYPINPCEYSNFKDCGFNNNFLDGVYLNGYHRDVVFDTCDLSRNGQYQLDSSTGKDRTYPIDLANIKVGVRVKTRDNIPGSNLKFTSCFGEECMGMFGVVANTGEGVFNNIIVENCVQSPLQRTPAEIALTKGMLYTFGQWIQQINFINNMQTNGVIGIYNVSASAIDKIILEGFLKTTFNISSDKLVRYFDDVSAKKITISDGFTNNSSLLKKSIGINNANWNDTYDASIHFSGTNSNRGIYPLVLLINSNWQATNSNQVGSYISIVQKGHDGTFKINNLAFSSVLGFQSPPSISSAGVITLSLSAFYAYTITRLDMKDVITL